MLKVNEEKILAEYKALQEKKIANLADIEAQVRPFAASLGYDEEKTKGLISYIQGQSGNGLSEEDAVKLEILSAYIDEVEEPIVENQVAGFVSEISYEQIISPIDTLS